MINKDLSIIVPFYNPQFNAFKECLMSIRSLNPFEVLLVDDCSTDLSIIELAKQSGFNYLKTSYQSGHDGLPYNIGLQHVTGAFVTKVDADDLLLELPSVMQDDIHLARMSRTVDPSNLSIEELILAPRSIHNGSIMSVDLAKEMIFSEDSSIFNDVLTILRLLYRKKTFSVHPKINYIYNDTTNSIQSSKTRLYHRLRHIQTIARFCQLESISHELSEYYLKLAMLNFRLGAKARYILSSDSSKKY